MPHERHGRNPRRPRRGGRQGTYLVTCSTSGRIARICAPSCAASMVGEATSPKVSLSAQVHSATLPATFSCALTQAARPPMLPAPVLRAPLNWSVKLVMKPVGETPDRWPPMNRITSRAGAAGRGRVGLVYRIDYIAGLASALGDHLLLQLLRVHLLLKLGLADIRAELGWRDERMGRAAAAQQQCADRHHHHAHGQPSRARQQPDP